MSKKKHFHSVRSGKRQAQAYAFFHRPNAWAQAKSQAFGNSQKKTAQGATNALDGKETQHSDN